MTTPASRTTKQKTFDVRYQTMGLDYRRVVVTAATADEARRKVRRSPGRKVLFVLEVVPKR